MVLVAKHYNKATCYFRNWQEIYTGTHFLNLVLNKTLFVHQICTIILLSASLYKVNKKHGILMNYMSLNGRASFIDKLFKLSIFFPVESLKLKLTQDIYLQYKKHLKVMHSGFSIFFLQTKYLLNFFAFK